MPDDVVAETAGNTVLRIGIAGGALGVLIAVVDTPPYLSLVFEGIIVLTLARPLYPLNTYTPANRA